MHQNWMVILPPCIVLACSWFSHRALLSLFIGIIASAYIASDFSLAKTITLSVQRFFEETTSTNNLLTFVYLILLGIVTSMISRSGGAKAFGAKITKKIRSAKSAETTTMLMTLFFMFDEYLNAMTTGVIMKSVSDRVKVSRAKLAFLIDAMAAPLTVAVPISAWIAALSRELSQAGITENVTASTVVIADPFAMYVKSIPFIFYSAIMIATVWFIVRTRTSFGCMKEHEEATISGNDSSICEKRNKTYAESGNHEEYKPSDIYGFVIPIVTLVVGIFSSLLISGKFILFGGSNGFFTALGAANVWISLPIGAVFGVVASSAVSMATKPKPLQYIVGGIMDGIKMVAPAVLFLLAAWTFSSLLRQDLQTGQYLANTLAGSIGPALLPMMFFITAILTAFSTGSSWSTISICVPMAVPMVISFMKLVPPVQPGEAWLLLPTIGAILSGAVAGDHISPVSETTVMASISTGIKNMIHVKTQLPYAIPPIIFSTIAFLISGRCAKHGYVVGCVVPLLICTILCLVTVYTLGKAAERKTKRLNKKGF